MGTIAVSPVYRRCLSWDEIRHLSEVSIEARSPTRFGSKGMSICSGEFTGSNFQSKKLVRGQPKARSVNMGMIVLSLSPFATCKQKVPPSPSPSPSPSPTLLLLACCGGSDSDSKNVSPRESIDPICGVSSLMIRTKLA
jgi:hypothetical protein